MKTLHFTLGPVQGFVAQARRTRDLYVGSFLLSYLAGWAMHEIKKSKGEIIFPDVEDDPLLQAICRHDEGKAIEDGPSLGSLPNRFKAKVPDDFDPNDCARAIKKAWKKIADIVWQEYVEEVADLGIGVRQIWDRQIDHFWEISWIIGKENNLLDRRKNWRSFVPTVEPGDKCTIMGNLQELSGYVRAQNAKKQDKFWRALRKNLRGMDLSEKERLSAVALVKRLFPRVAKRAIGWKLPINYPSTANLSSVAWLSGLIEEKSSHVQDLACFAQKLPPEFKTNLYHLNCISVALQNNKWAEALADLNGECFYENSLLNDNIWPEDTAEVRQEMHNKLRQLSVKPSPFYALLLMDGDRLGALLREVKGDETVVSRALAQFAAKVNDIVNEHNGVTVYAGGDDVLALLPLEYALKAAIALRNAYKEAFIKEFSADIENKATISGAIVYAHYNVPLKAVLLEGHKLLDEVAKDKTGRDSLAVTVWKGSGSRLIWAAPWKAFVKGDTNLIDELVNLFSDQRQSQYNSSFFYNLRERFEILTDEEFKFKWQEEVDLLTAEYLKNRMRDIKVDEAKQNIERLLQICHRSWRDDDGVLHYAEGPLSIDGALLVRFLAAKGVRE